MFDQESVNLVATGTICYFLEVSLLDLLRSSAQPSLFSNLQIFSTFPGCCLTSFVLVATRANTSLFARHRGFGSDKLNLYPRKRLEIGSLVALRLKLASYFGIYLVIAGGGKTPELNKKNARPQRADRRDPSCLC
jgi:hypothetical protein